MENIIVKLQLHMLIISETWLKPDTHITMAEYNTYRTEREDHYGGLLIWIHHSIPVATIHKSKPEDKLQYITINTANITIAEIYDPLKYTYKEEVLESINQHSTNQTRIIAGDFNISKYNIEKL